VGGNPGALIAALGDGSSDQSSAGVTMLAIEHGPLRAAPAIPGESLGSFPDAGSAIDACD
jgi:hypothetical protein